MNSKLVRAKMRVRELFASRHGAILFLFGQELYRGGRPRGGGGDSLPNNRGWLVALHDDNQLPNYPTARCKKNEAAEPKPTLYI